jgi:hypothetical protein
MRVTTLLGALLVAAAALSLVGCATLHRSEAQNTEQVLAAAGFRAKPADTPAKLENLKTMPPRKLVSHVEDGHFVYSYADPDNCRCLYVGGETEYSAFQKLSIEKQIADERYLAATDWDMGSVGSITGDVIRARG